MMNMNITIEKWTWLAFSFFTLQGVPEVLPGRLFTTRMPRNIKENPASAEAFRRMVRKNDLHTCGADPDREEGVREVRRGRP
jgi:hypothetical protein